MWNGLPFRPRESDAPLTAPSQFKLATNARASERQAYDRTIEQKWKAIEVRQGAHGAGHLLLRGQAHAGGRSADLVLTAGGAAQEEKAAAEEAARKAEEEAVRQYRRTLRFKVRARPGCMVQRVRCVRGT